MNNALLPDRLIYGKKVVNTIDGSYTFYSLEYNEAFKTKSIGAFTESFHKFISASKILERVEKKDIRLLDICFGIGQNIATTLNYLSDDINRLHIVSVERDYTLLSIVNHFKILSPMKGYNRLRKLLKNGNDGGVSLELHIMDAIDFIDMLSGKFDVIYFDPFSKRNNPLMWSADIFKKMYNLLSDGGVLLTYGSSKEIVADMQTAGFVVDYLASVGSRKHKSVIAKKIDLIT